MRIYGDRGSSNTRRILTVATHLQIDFEFKLVNLFEGENRNQDYLSLNPNGTIPTLVDGNLTLFEASAIMIYLAEKANSSLWPSDQTRYHVLKWMFWAAEHFRRGPAILIEERFMGRFRGYAADATLVANAIASIRRYAAVLDQHLDNRLFAAGPAPSLADIDLAAPFSHISRTGAPFAEYSNLEAWHRRLGEAIPAWQETGAQLELRIVEIESLFEERAKNSTEVERAVQR
ncbi:glutathione S-transferase family protein [Pseudomonas aeruginosa]|uniref:glutathione S-transferase family protein n=1 Tax=Pseudomonas aeruginosa TaxID=287 RepID=UPI003CC649DD